MYNPYNVDLAGLRQQEMIAGADRRRLAMAARRARRERRAMASGPIDLDLSDRRPTTRPALPLRA